MYDNIHKRIIIWKTAGIGERLKSVRCFEAFYIEFDADGQHNSDERNDRVKESVFVMKSRLDMLLNHKFIFPKGAASNTI